jgi:tetratricopeptide (TPR) repeat protein
MCAAARDQLLELGWNFDAALMAIDLGPIELWSGRAEAAERELRRGYDALHAMGEQNYVSTTAQLLGEAVRRLGREDEALSLADESREVADEDDVATQAGWRGVRSRVLVSRGRTDEALELAREALELVLATDDLGGQGEAQLDLAAALAASGDRDGARAAAAAAFDAFDRKAHRPGRSEAEALLDQL